MRTHETFKVAQLGWSVRLITERSRVQNSPGSSPRARITRKENSQTPQTLFLYLSIAILVVAAVLYIAANNVSPAPTRSVEAQILSSSYNKTSDEFTVHALLVPSDDNLCLSKVAFPDVNYYRPVNQPLRKNGTSLALVCSDWSMFAGTPYSGATVYMVLHFTDVNTGQDVHEGKVTVTYP